MTLPAGVAASFVAVFDSPSLHVGMSVYDDSGANPVLHLAPFAMALVVGNTYRGKFTPANGKSYIVLMAVYTDNTFGTLDTDYAEQNASISALYLAPQVQNVVGIVQNTEAVVGVVDCS